MHTGHVHVSSYMLQVPLSLFVLLLCVFRASFFSLCVPCLLLFSVCLAWGDMLARMLKGLWQVCEWKIVPKPLTKDSLTSGRLCLQPWINPSIFMEVLHLGHLGALLLRTQVEKQQCPLLDNSYTAPLTLGSCRVDEQNGLDNSKG